MVAEAFGNRNDVNALIAHGGPAISGDPWTAGQNGGGEMFLGSRLSQTYHVGLSYPARASRLVPATFANQPLLGLDRPGGLSYHVE